MEAFPLILSLSCLKSLYSSSAAPSGTGRALRSLPVPSHSILCSWLCLLLLPPSSIPCSQLHPTPSPRDAGLDVAPTVHTHMGGQGWEHKQSLAVSVPNMDKIQLYPEDAHLINHVLINPPLPRLVCCVTPKNSFEKHRDSPLKGSACSKEAFWIKKAKKGFS